MHIVRSVTILFFKHCCPVFPTPLIEEAVFSPLYIPASFVKEKVCGFVSRLSILFHWSILVFLYQYHIVKALYLVNIVDQH